MHGKVKFFNRVKGFGYILGDDGNSYFVSHRDIDSAEPFKYLMAGDEVVFDAINQPEFKEGKAINVSERRSEGKHEEANLQYPC